MGSSFKEAGINTRGGQSSKSELFAIEEGF